MRLFLAIGTEGKDGKLKDGIIGMQDEMRRRGVRGNFTPPENLHITATFIGEYGDPDRVLEALEPLRFSPFRICVERIGAMTSFENLWYAAIREDASLSAAVRGIRHLLADAEIPFDRKKFNPHITLVRRPSFTREPHLETIPIPQDEAEITKISLMLSTRGKNGMIYTELGYINAIQ